MIKISTVIPFRYRLDIHIVRVRGASREPEKLIPNIRTVLNSRSGNKMSRFFRHIFEHKHVRRILGSNIALAIIATSFIPTSAANFAGEAEESLVGGANTVVIATQGHIHYPTAQVKINQGFSFFHPGIDFDGITGDPIKPIMAGEVEMIQKSSVSYGNAVLIRHGDNFSSLYAHLSKIEVVPGQKVDMDTVIGKMGSTGRSSGDHLHLEVRENGRPINPLSMLPRI